MSGGPAGRALWRMATRSLRTEPLRHLLIVVLLALAVASAVATSIGVRAVQVTDAQRDAARLGAAEFVLSREADGLRLDQLGPQARAEVERRFADPVATSAAPDPSSVLDEELPAGAVTTRVDRGWLELPGLPALVEVWVADPSAPLLEGTLRTDPDALVGSEPLEAGEALLSARLLDHLEIEVGGTARLPGIDPLVVRGTVEAPLSRSTPLVVAGPGTDVRSLDEQRWFVRTPDETGHEVGAAVLDRLEPVVDDAPQHGTWYHVHERGWSTFDPRPGPELSGLLVGAVLLVQVAALAAAAFATGARRRVREFGVLAAAAGAEPRHLAGLVRREAAVLGGIGAGMGAVLGLVVAVRSVALLERIADRALPAVTARPLDLVLPAVLGVAAAVAAAWSPARTVARVPTVIALAGRVPSRRGALWSAPVAAVTVLVGALLAAVGVRSPDGGMLLPVVGIVVLLLGAAALAGPLLDLGARAVGRLRATARVAVLDSARQRTRSAVTVAATLVVLVVPVAVATLSASEEALDRVLAERVRDDLVVIAGPTFGTAQLSPTSQAVDRVLAALPVEPVAVHEVALFEAPAGMFDLDPAGLLPVGTEAAALATRPLLDLVGVGEVPAGTVVVAPSSSLVGEAPPPERGRLTIPGAGGAPVDVIHAPEAVPYALPETLVPSELAEALDLEPVTRRTVVRLPRALSTDEAETLVATASAGGDPQLAASVSVEGPRQDRGRGSTWLVTGVALLVALAIAAATAALAATESDRDLELLLAVGADPRTRPRVRAWQVGYHALLAVGLAIPVGVVLAVVVGAAGPVPTTVVPWGWLASLLVGVPLVLALPFRWLSRSTPTGPGARRIA